MRGAFPLAYSMALTLGEVKKNVRLIDGIGMAYPEEAMNLEEEDVCLVYAFPRYLRMAMDMVRNIKERRVRIILVTSQAYHNMEKLVDVVIPCFVEGYSFKSSMVAPLALNNYLITEVTMRDQAGRGNAGQNGRVAESRAVSERIVCPSPLVFSPLKLKNPGWFLPAGRGSTL